MNKSESIKELATALAKAQGEIENANKNAANPHFRSKYADLAEVLNTVRPVFAKHGLSISQWPGFDGGLVTVETILMHSSGEYMSSTASAPIGKLDAQGVGSALTYLRRYSLAAIAGIAQEDDDGNAASYKPKFDAAAKVVAADVKPLSGVWEQQPEDMQIFLHDLSKEVTSLVADNELKRAHEQIEQHNLDADQKAALWTRLDSKTRAQLKSYAKSMRELDD